MLNLVIAHPLYCCVICAKPLPARLGYDHNANGQRIERRGYMGCLWMVQTPVPTLAMATLGGMEITKALTRLKGLENDPVFMLLHGWGSNEYDLPDLLNYCGAGSADYASLQAPIAYGMGYTWFGSWAHEGVPEGKSLDEQALVAAQAIDAWVGANIPATRPIVMMGFSQGGLLATHMLRFNPNRYAAAVSCSGWLAPGTVDGDAQLASLQPPVFYGHGAIDDIFPKADVAAMGTFWREHGTLTEEVYPGMAHSINMPEMRDIQRFLEKNGFIRPQIW